MKERLYDSNIGDKYNSKQARRFRELIADAGALAKHLGISTQMVSQYRQGTALPKIDNLLKIADYYNVSLDYIVGNTDVKSRDTTIQGVCESTGLSEKAVERIKQANASLINPVFTQVLNELLESDAMLAILLNITAVKNHCERIVQEGFEDGFNEHRMLNGELFAVNESVQDALNMLYNTKKIKGALLATELLLQDDDDEGSENNGVNETERN